MESDRSGFYRKERNDPCQSAFSRIRNSFSRETTQIEKSELNIYNRGANLRSPDRKSFDRNIRIADQVFQFAIPEIIDLPYHSRAFGASA